MTFLPYGKLFYFSRISSLLSLFSNFFIIAFTKYSFHIKYYSFFIFHFSTVLTSELAITSVCILLHASDFKDKKDLKWKFQGSPTNKVVFQVDVEVNGCSTEEKDHADVIELIHQVCCRTICDFIILDGRLNWIFSVF